MCEAAFGWFVGDASISFFVGLLTYRYLSTPLHPSLPPLRVFEPSGYSKNDAQQALDICRKVFRTDPHNAACLPVYLAAMVGAGMMYDRMVGHDCIFISYGMI